MKGCHEGGGSVKGELHERKGFHGEGHSMKGGAMKGGCYEGPHSFWSTSGRYTSYWNALLLCNLSPRLVTIKFFCKISSDE